MARPNVGDLIPIGAIGSAKKGDVLEGKTYSSDEGVDLEGTMPNRGAINRTITTQGGKIIVPEGYHDGSGIVKAQFANLIASNIRDGVTIGGVRGTLLAVTDFTISTLSSGTYTIPAEKTGIIAVAAGMNDGGRVRGAYAIRGIKHGVLSSGSRLEFTSTATSITATLNDGTMSGYLFTF